MKYPYWGLEGFLFSGFGLGFFSAWRGQVLFFGFVVSRGRGNIHGARGICKIIFAAMKCNSFVFAYLANSSRRTIGFN